MTIEELLKSMYTLPKEGGVTDNKRVLENSVDTWKRIQAKDEFKELSFESESEKEAFLKDWIDSNPYSSL